MFYFFALTFFVLVAACNNTPATEVADNSNTTATTTKDTTIQTNVVDTRITELEQWKTLIETNSDGLMKVVEYKYACEGWGGVLKLTYDKDKLRAIVHDRGGNDGLFETQKFFFDESDALAMIWVETKNIAEDPNMVQSTYYAKYGVPFKAITKEVTGNPDEFDKKIAEAQAVDTETNRFTELKTIATELAALKKNKVEAYFCGN